jgi:GT2 family glycosyltransferase
VSAPAVGVVIASHGRALRLRWLLNALEEQRAAGSFEVVVVHDYEPAERARLLDDHPLVRTGAARLLAIARGSGSPARQRNLGWRAARASLIAFTDDDCRPEPEWLAALVAAAHAHPGAIVQGATRPDPFEQDVMAAPHIRTLTVTPPTSRAQTCNILYPRAVLEALGGFDEHAVVGEDVDLALRARAAGVALAAAPAAVVHHAVEAFTLPGIVRQNWKWRHLPWLLARHPELRRECRLGVFWVPRHGRLALAAAGMAAARAHPALALLGLPYAAEALSRRGPGARAHAVALAELPGQACADAAELATYAIGSARHRTLVL